MGESRPFMHKYVYPVILIAATIFYVVYFKQFFVEQYMRFKLRNSHIVVSMSTTPYRIDKIDAVLQSVIQQNAHVEAIYLNVPYKFNRDGTEYVIPASLQHNNKITILRSYDYGPSTKLLGLLINKNVPQDAIIITLDDDIEYPKHIVLHLAYASLQNPNQAVGLSGADLYASDEKIIQIDKNLGLKTKYNYAGPVTILQGYAGIAYRTSFFKDDVFDIINYPAACINSDDVYLSFYLAKNSIHRLSIANHYAKTFSVDPDTSLALAADALQMQNPGPAEKHQQCLAYLNTRFPEVDFSNKIIGKL